MTEVVKMKKYLPIGIQDYRKLRIENYYTVDKTMIINEFLERKAEVTLITRPRRFGKTLNMSMMAEFFDITKDSNALFKGLAILDTEHRKEMNQSPVVFVSFANSKGNAQEIIKYMKLEITKEYERYSFIFEKLTVFQKSAYDKIVASLLAYDDGKIDGVSNALTFLMQKLEEYYGKKVYLFVDEYDTPFIQAHTNGFYEEIHNGLSNLLSTTLKGNQSLALAMLTGIQRIAKENVFSGLNNLKVCSIENRHYAQYFGFSPMETESFLHEYGMDLTDEVKQMYDGYQFGGNEIYNPWSLINYVDSKLLQPYWVNTSANTMIKKAMHLAEASFKDGYETLILTGKVTACIDMSTSFFEQASTQCLWGLFVNAGYLTIEKIIDLESHLYQLRIPNREVLDEFKDLTAEYLGTEPNELFNLYQSFLKKDKELFIETYKSILMTNPSYYDLENENSYHMLMLGLCLYLKKDFDLISNREVGMGRCDLILKAKKNSYSSYVIEFKYVSKESYEKNSEHLLTLVNDALKQIKLKRYDYELSGEIIHIALAHYGKKVEMKWSSQAIEE